MQVTLILICLIVISKVQAALVTKMPKPKFNLTHSQHLQSPEILKHKSLEERRKFSLFPKSYMKYVISSEPIYKIATHKPMVHGTRKPLMKKLNLHDNKNKVVENETEQPFFFCTVPMYEKEFATTPEVDTVLVGEEISIEVVVVEDKSEESNEKQDDNSEEEDKQQNDSNQIKTATAYTENKEYPNLEDLIFPPTLKPIEVIAENKNIEAFPDVSDKTKNYKENESPDWKEFIFVAPTRKLTESDKISSEKSEEYFTTEFYEELEIVRQKRGSNVIEEENLASTVAGYKYTWKDTRLNNDVAYKNIHS